MSKLKIRETHLIKLRDAINEFAVISGGWDKLIHRYECGDFFRADKVKDLNKRFRWDCLNACRLNSAWICDNLYPYLDDAHIDSALRSIVPTLSRNY